MSSTLTLQRAATGAAELRRSSFEIILDGRPAGSIERHQTVELQVEPGPHTLQVRAGRYSSPARSFDTVDGASISFRCNGAIPGPNTSRLSSCRRSGSDCTSNHA